MHKHPVTVSYEFSAKLWCGNLRYLIRSRLAVVIFDPSLRIDYYNIGFLTFYSWWYNFSFCIDIHKWNSIFTEKSVFFVENINAFTLIISPVSCGIGQPFVFIQTASKLRKATSRLLSRWMDEVFSSNLQYSAQWKAAMWLTKLLCHSCSRIIDVYTRIFFSWNLGKRAFVSPDGGVTLKKEYALFLWVY